MVLIRRVAFIEELVCPHAICEAALGDGMEHKPQHLVCIVASTARLDNVGHIQTVTHISNGFTIQTDLFRDPQTERVVTIGLVGRWALHIPAEKVTAGFGVRRENRHREEGEQYGQFRFHNSVLVDCTCASSG